MNVGVEDLVRSKLLIDGQWVDGASRDRLTDKYSGRLFGEMEVASPDQVDRAVTGAIAAVQASQLKPDDRYRILSKASRIVEARIESSRPRGYVVRSWNSAASPAPSCATMPIWRSPFPKSSMPASARLAKSAPRCSACVDVMPFGGVKDSGYGREGPAYAIREMTEERLITIAY